MEGKRLSLQNAVQIPRMEALHIQVRHAAGLRSQIASEQASIALKTRALGQEIKDLKSRVKNKTSIVSFRERLLRAPKEDQERYRIRVSSAMSPRPCFRVVVPLTVAPQSVSNLLAVSERV